MKTISILLLSLAVLIAAGAVPFRAATDDNPSEETAPCTLSSANGAYGFVESGTILGLGPYVSAGTVISDGQGNMKGIFAENAAGLITNNITFAGTYTVNPDCTGTLIFTDNRGRTASRAAVIVQHGREIDYIFTVPRIPGTGVAKKQ